MLTIRAAGFSGIAAITLAGGFPGEDERQIGRWRAMRRHIAQIAFGGMTIFGGDPGGRAA